MSNNADFPLTDYLTPKRFEQTLSQTTRALMELRKQGEVDQQLIDDVAFEDAKLTIKRKSFKRCRIQVLVCAIIVAIVLLKPGHSPIYTYALIIALIVMVSSLFGLRSNRLSKQEKAYIND